MQRGASPFDVMLLSISQTHNTIFNFNCSANAKLEALNKTHANDMKKLTAQLKKEEISRHSIMEQLAQKSKENDELVKICDELINNGGDGS